MGPRFVWGSGWRFPTSQMEREMTRSGSSESAGPRRVDGSAAGAGGGAPRGGELVPLAEPLLDCAAAAALLNVRVSWVRDAARLGNLPCVRVGRHLRFTRVMLEDWLAGQVASPPATPAPGRGYARGGGTLA